MMPTLYVSIFVNIDLPNSERGVNTFFYMLEGASISGDGQQHAVDLASQFLTNFQEPYENLMSSSVTLSSVVCSLHTPTGVFTVVNNVGIPGENEGDVCPNFVAAVMTRRCTAPPRQAKGRVFVPGIPEAFTTGNKLNIPGKVAAAGFAEAMFFPLDTMTLHCLPAVPSRKDVSLRVMTSASANDFLGTMRSRKARF